MKKTDEHKNLDLEMITMLRNEKNLDAIRKVVSMQTNMMLNAEEYHAGLIDKGTYAKNVASTEEGLNKIILDTKKDLDYLADVEKEVYEALKKRRES